MIKFLSKVRSNILFILFLLLSTASIFSRINKIRVYCPAILVAGYGILLLLQQKSRALSYNEKDSPYFLGFTLTLIALLKTFIKYGSTSATSPIIFEGIGIAISTTIVGLVFRYIIIISDSREKKQTELLNILAEQQEKTIISYTNAQEGLLSLITSFHKHHQKIIEEELEHHNKFITAVENMRMKLNETYSNLVRDSKGTAELLKNEFDLMTQSLSKLSDNFNESNKKFQAVQNIFINNIENVNEQLKSTDLKTSIQTLQNSFSNISGELQNLFTKIEVNLKDFSENLSMHLSNIDKSVEHSILGLEEKSLSIIKNFTDSLESVKNSSILNFNDFNKAVKYLSEQTEIFGDVLKNTKNNIDTSTNEIINDMKNSITNTSTDLKIIDQLLTDFTDTVKKHINKFGKFIR